MNQVGPMAAFTVAVSGAASFTGGSITIATITTPAPGILGAIGLTTTSTIVVPIAAVAGVAAMAGYGIYKGFQMAKSQTNSQQTP